MRSQQSRTILALASLLAMLMVSASTVPASAAPRRHESMERLSLRLVNCLRTGGRITPKGSCKGYGSGRFSKYRAPLKRSRRISDNVSWQWARRTAVKNICGHTLAGSTVDQRFRQAGLRHRDNGENIGCGNSWATRRMVIQVHRWWQAERSYNGWHWRQVKDRDFKAVGIAVARHGSGRSRVVVNFYGRRVR